LLLAFISIAISGCTSLAPRPQLAQVGAVAADPGSRIGKTVDAALGADARSGFRLLPIATTSFETRIELAAETQHTLDLQYYVFSDDNTGRLLMRAARDAALRGVRVRILVDDLYTSGEDPILKGLAAFQNVEVRLFNPFPTGRDSMLGRLIASANDAERIDHRMHNKLFIADNQAAVLGGRNIADEYFMRSQTSNFVDTDLLAVGPIVRSLSAIFDGYWNSAAAYPLAFIVSSEMSREKLQQDFDQRTRAAASPPTDVVASADDPYLSVPGELRAGHLNSLVRANAAAYADSVSKVLGANEETLTGTATSQVLAMLASAQRSALLVSPYFVPGKIGMEALKAERDRGVDVTVITNSLASTDEPLVHVGYLRYRRQMLQLGIHIHELSPTLVARRAHEGNFHSSQGALHAKLAIIDGHQVFLGSMNMDLRSARENTELAVIIDSPELAQQIMARLDRGSSYDVRLNGHGDVQWVAEDGGRDSVFEDEPEAGFWTKREVDLLAPFVPEKQL
jgi:phosphatidylserine/phosphatidylglycerophosphate/cardiolipin synthase-like enzyme